MSDKEKLDIICENIRSSRIFISDIEQQKINEKWIELSKTSTQKRAMLDRQMHRVSQKNITR